MAAEHTTYVDYTLTTGEGDDAVSILPDNAEGVMTDEAIEVKYYYLKSASVRVKYVDESKNKK